MYSKNFKYFFQTQKVTHGSYCEVMLNIREIRVSNKSRTQRSPATIIPIGKKKSIWECYGVWPLQHTIHLQVDDKEHSILKVVRNHISCVPRQSFSILHRCRDTQSITRWTSVFTCRKQFLCIRKMSSETHKVPNISEVCSKNYESEYGCSRGKVLESSEPALTSLPEGASQSNWETNSHATRLSKSSNKMLPKPIQAKPFTAIEDHK